MIPARLPPMLIVDEPWLVYAGVADQVAPTIPGIEFTLPINRAHFELPENRAHHTLPENRPHFEIPEEA